VPNVLDSGLDGRLEDGWDNWTRDQRTGHEQKKEKKKKSRPKIKYLHEAAGISTF
jgi:hypothetical protein